MRLNCQAIPFNSRNLDAITDCGRTATSAPFAVAHSHTPAMVIDRRNHGHDFSNQPSDAVVQ
jgi:hypothetical protein